MEASTDITPESRHDEFLLAQFLAARSAGDDAAAKAAWNELVAMNLDRVDGMVRIESRGRLSPEEQDEAVQNALIKLLTNMMRTFRGTSMGEWVNATRTLVFGVCVDVQRRAERHSRHKAPLHATDEDGGGYTAAVNGALLDRAALEAADEDAAAIYDVAAGFLDWALPQVTEKRRAVIELDLQGLACEEIQARLGLSRDAVYANRSRAIKDLTALRKEYAPA